MWHMQLVTRTTMIPKMTLAMILGALPSAAYCETVGAVNLAQTKELHEWLDAAATLNRPSMIDAAGSQGSYGTNFGAGFSRISTNPHNRLIAEETGNSDTSANSLNVPKVWISRGSILPVDFTLTGGATQDRKFANAGAIVQVTLFEALALPAISIRGFAGRTFGNMNTTVKSQGGEAAISMGFLRYIRVYAAAGRAWHQATIAAKPESRTFTLLQDSVQDANYHRTWNEYVRSAGIKITLLPGRLSMAAETESFDTKSEAFSVRLTAHL